MILTVTTKMYPDSAVIYPSVAQQLPTGCFTKLMVEHRDKRTNLIVRIYEADLQYAISTLRPGYGKMTGLFFIGIKPVQAKAVPVVTSLQPTVSTAPALTSNHSFGFKARRKELGLKQKQIIRRTGLSPYEISLLENDKIDLKGIHPNTWEKLPLGYGKEFVENVREQLKDLPGE